MFSIFSEYPILLVVIGLFIAVFVFVMSRRTKPDAPMVDTPGYSDVIHKRDRNLSEYIEDIEEIYSRGIPDGEFRNCVNEVIRNLKHLENQSAANPSTKSAVERFADRYLPIIIDNISKFRKIQKSDSEVYQRTKGNVLKTLEMFNDAVNVTIQKIEKSGSEEIEINNQAIQSLLKLNEDIQAKGDFLHEQK